MDGNILSLVIGAMTISFIHTVSGPDHYLPFIVLSKSRNWSKRKTIMVTTFCGIGHVLSSLIVGAIAIFLGWQLNKFDWFQNVRGSLSGWLLLIFGGIYFIYGVFQNIRNKSHKHFDVLDDEVYVYKHKHGEISPKKRVRVTPLILFMIFVMGPSGPFTPLLFYSGMNESMTQIIAQVIAFAVTKITTMLVLVIVGRYGYFRVFSEKLEPYMSAISGFVVFICGIGMVVFEW